MQKNIKLQENADNISLKYEVLKKKYQDLKNKYAEIQTKYNSLLMKTLVKNQQETSSISIKPQIMLYFLKNNSSC